MGLEDDMAKHMMDGNVDGVIELLLNPLRQLERWGDEVTELAEDFEEAGRAMKNREVTRRLAAAARYFKDSSVDALKIGAPLNVAGQGNSQGDSAEAS